MSEAPLSLQNPDVKSGEPRSSRVMAMPSTSGVRSASQRGGRRFRDLQKAQRRMLMRPLRSTGKRKASIISRWWPNNSWLQDELAEVFGVVDQRQRQRIRRERQHDDKPRPR